MEGHKVVSKGDDKGDWREQVTTSSNPKEDEVKTPEEIEDSIQSIPTVTWDPFTVLPKEIYLEIFKMVDNPTDKLNFMNAHSEWYDLFMAERVRCLFGKVIGDLPLDVVPNGTDRNLTRLRLICRGWNQGIQYNYQLHPDHFEFVFCEDAWKNNSKQLKQQYRDGYLVEIRRRLDRPRPRARQLQNDLEQFTASHPPSKNPLLTRKVSIRIYDDGVMGLGVLTQQVDTLLDTYGQHIWHFSVHFGSKFTPERYIKIVNWLQQMADLKTLQICFGDWRNFTNHDATNFNMTQFVRPEMRKLQNLHVSNFPTYAFNKLLEGMRSVEKLEVDIKDCSHYYIRLRGYQLPTNLTEAALTVTGNEDFRHLSTLDQFPHLRKLILNLESEYQKGGFISGYRITWTEWKAIWVIIEEKFPALEDLHLSLPKNVMAQRKKALEQSLDCRLKLTKLKRLSILLPNLSSLDFLQENKGLQELKIHLEHFQENIKSWDNLARKERIKFSNINLGAMEESNIWEIFPKLKVLFIHAVVIRGNIRGIEVHSYEKREGQERVYNKII